MKATKVKKVPVCSVCQKPATRTVDGEDSCEQHAQQIYEHQLEDYTRDHVLNGDWPESSSGDQRPRTRAKKMELVTKP